MPPFRVELQRRLDAKAALASPPVLTVMSDQATNIPETIPVEPFVTVAPGPRNARTDPDGLRFYTWQGREYPSVTTIRRLAGIPHGLHQWTISQVILRAVTEHDELERMLTRERRPRERVLEKNRMEEASKWLRAAATEERDEAGDLGKAVHDAAAQGRLLAQVPPEVRPRLRQYQHWLAKAKPEILATEFQVFNLEVGYGGTGDLLARWPNGWIDICETCGHLEVVAEPGEVIVVDLKSGRGTYPEHALQVLAYSMAGFAGQDDVIDEHLTALLRQVTGMAILHLADDGWKFIRVKPDADAWVAFRGLLRFAVWMHAHPDIDDVTAATRRGSEDES